MVKNCIGPQKCARAEEIAGVLGCLVSRTEWRALSVIEKCPGPKIKPVNDKIQRRRQ